MTHEQALRARQKLLDRLPLTGEILRGLMAASVARVSAATSAMTVAIGGKADED
jgi:hypothetical protein